MHKKLFEKPDWRENDIARQVTSKKVENNLIKDKIRKKNTHKTNKTQSCAFALIRVSDPH